MDSKLNTSRNVISRSIVQLQNPGLVWTGSRDSTLLVKLASIEANGPLNEEFEVVDLTNTQVDVDDEFRESVMDELDFEVKVWDVETFNEVAENLDLDGILSPIRGHEDQNLSYFEETSGFTRVRPLLHFSTNQVATALKQEDLFYDGWNEGLEEVSTDSGSSTEEVMERLQDLGYK
jgi:3'-phosphoadenosine 5'-phosphosulfate sulfotransferase (PAPS reductase)/FAD synthetase